MTKTEQKVFDYAQSVEWDYDKVDDFIYNLTDDEFDEIECSICTNNKTDYFIKKHKPKQPQTITLPIDDYNRLRKLEIKQQIKKLKKELKRL